MRGASRAMREPPCATVGTPDILPDSVAVAIQPPRRSSVHARSRYTSGLAIPRTSPIPGAGPTQHPAVLSPAFGPHWPDRPEHLADGEARRPDTPLAGTAATL